MKKLLLIFVCLNLLGTSTILKHVLELKDNKSECKLEAGYYIDKNNELKFKIPKKDNRIPFIVNEE